MITGLSLYEQEVIINLNADDETADVYTSYPAWIRKLDKIAASNPSVTVKRSDEVSRTYVIPKKYVSIRAPRRVVMSEEQKKACRERLAKARKEKNNGLL